MASSSSSSSSTCKLGYKVFLSFRGEDTRNSFTSNLYKALCQNYINTFIDDEFIRGDQISPSLLKAIEESKISIIIFSKEYASSRWCLLELEKILECNNKYDQIVLPVFYHVDPSDVRKQTGDFGTAFAQLEERFKDDSEVLKRWRTALNEAGSLSGIVSKEFRNEASLVKVIVEHILKVLNEGSSVIDTKNLVGLDSAVEEIENLLCRTGVHKLGIWGIGGIGKTTLATVVFNKIYRQFEASYFIRNIREESERSGGLNDMRQRLFYHCLGDKHPNVESSFSSKRLSGKKVLIVFDDVTHLEQLQHLMGVFDYLDFESRIIITTRDEHVLKPCGMYKVDHIHKMKELSGDDAFQLFTLYAKCPEDYIELSSRAIAYAKGVPLALKVLGSTLYQRGKMEWESYIECLSRIPHMDIQKVLKVSYDGLNDEEQQVFLDIACFFEGYNRDLIEEILDACGVPSHTYINVLIERSLITTSFNIITMHGLLQEMGREIVRQESIDDPGRCSRLWDHEDILKVLTKDKGTEVIRSMRLNMSKVSEKHLNLEAFKNMQNLKFLEVYGCEYDKKVPGLEVLSIFKPCFEWFLWKFFENNSSEHEEKLHGFEVQKSYFSELRCLLWDGYSANSLPPNFNPKNLVVLYMRFSKVKQLWNGDQKQNLVNLKLIDLSYSKRLCRMPNLSITPNLESLILEGCANLRESFSSMHNLDKLVLLNLQGCKNMDMLSISPQCRSLREVILSNCSNLKAISYIPCAVEQLYLDGTAIEELPSLEHLSRLVTLNLKNCSELKSLPESIRGCKSLEYFYLSYSSKLDRLPEGLGNLTALKTLELEGISIREVPPSIACLNNLERLSLARCTIENPLSLLPHDLSFLNKLTMLNLSYSCIKELPSNLGQLRYLERLYIMGNNFESLPGTIKDLSNLRKLCLDNCQRLKSLPELPHQLIGLTAWGCISLEELSSLPITTSVPRLFEPWEIDFINCYKLKLHALPELKKALLNIQRNAVLWFHSKERESKQLWGPEMVLRGCILYPGSDISDWFNFRSSENFIKLPPGCLNDNLIGFAVCAVISSPHTGKWVNNAFGARFNLSINEKLVFCGPLCNSFSSLVVIESNSDHAFIGYDYRIMPSELLPLSSNSEGFIKFSVGDSSPPFFKLKKCGVRLLYAEDNDLSRDARVDRDQRLKSINGSDDDCI